MTKLRILKWRGYPGWSSWGCCNHKSPSKREARRSRKEEIGWQIQKLGVMLLGGRGSGPGAKHCRWSLKAGEDKETDSPLASRKEPAVLMLWFLAHWDTLQTSDLQNYKITNDCCLKPPTVWQFVIASVGSSRVRTHAPIPNVMSISGQDWPRVWTPWSVLRSHSMAGSGTQTSNF